MKLIRTKTVVLAIINLVFATHQVRCMQDSFEKDLIYIDQLGISRHLAQKNISRDDAKALKSYMQTKKIFAAYPKSIHKLHNSTLLTFELQLCNIIINKRIPRYEVNLHVMEFSTCNIVNFLRTDKYKEAVDCLTCYENYILTKTKSVFPGDNIPHYFAVDAFASDIYSMRTNFIETFEGCTNPTEDDFAKLNDVIKQTQRLKYFKSHQALAMLNKRLLMKQDLHRVQKMAFAGTFQQRTNNTHDIFFRFIPTIRN